MAISVACTEEEYQALVKDAARYRWLRDKGLDAVDSYWADSRFICEICDAEVDEAMKYYREE